jgi:hypothetical protein
MTGISRSARTGALLALGVTLFGCNPDDPNTILDPPTCNEGASGQGGDPSEGGGGSGSGAAPGTGGGEPEPTILDERVLDYDEALRTAALKLVGNVPTLAETEALRTAADQPAKYAELVDAMMLDDRFKRRMVDFWRNELRTGGTTQTDSAANFAARTVVEGRPYSDLFLAQSNTCPTFDGTTFADGDCTNANPTAGLLTNPALLAQYFGALSFRRVRFYQEIFACKKLPAEFSDTPIPMGAGDYTAPWPFESIAGASNGGRIDFLDTSSAICANCHATMNHRGPLFGNFDAAGVQQPQISVNTPVIGNPVSVFGDWLPEGGTPAYKFEQPAATLLEMGQRMAVDDEVQTCAVARVWNFAMSRGDIVNDAANVPTEVIADLVASFKASNGNLRATMREVFLHPDFVRF